MPAHRHLSKRRALQIAPALKEDSLVGAIQYYDAQVDDARHTMMIARTAATYGAAVATSVRVSDLIRDGQRVTVTTCAWILPVISPGPNAASSAAGSTSVR